MWVVLVLVCFSGAAPSIEPTQSPPTCYRYTWVGEHVSYMDCKAEADMWRDSPWLDRQIFITALLVKRPVERAIYKCIHAGWLL